MNIALIGMAGAGKSFVGKRLADALGYSFVDIDSLIEERYGKSLQEVLDTLGDSAFMQKESAVLIESTQGKKGLVISPGGSIVYSTEAMEHLKETAHTVYLEVPFETIEARVGKKPRGIVGLGKKTLKDIYTERISLYEKWANIRIAAEGKDADMIAREILEKQKSI